MRLTSIIRADGSKELLSVLVPNCQLPLMIYVCVLIQRDHLDGMPATIKQLQDNTITHTINMEF